ncbi:MAG: EFR1 family ferrodoxin [Sediminispirochaetaceae bacterium]
MNTTLYYYSGTGNSLSTAKKLAASIGETEIVPISEVPGNPPERRGKTIGFIFPTHAYGLPRSVREFAETFSPEPGTYIFAVVSCCGIPGPVLKELDKNLKKNGHGLDAGFAVLDPSGSLSADPDNDAVQRIMISVNRGAQPQPSSARLPEIVETVRARAPHTPESSNLLTNLLGGLLHRLAAGTFPASGRKFRVSDVCTGCGMCAKVCPRDNIRFNDNGRPEWGDDCEFCHACIQWCPNTAIEYGDISVGKPRYHNTEVTISEMVLR